MEKETKKTKNLTKCFVLSPKAVRQIAKMANKDQRNLSNFLTVYFEELADKEGKE